MFSPTILCSSFFRPDSLLSSILGISIAACHSSTTTTSSPHQNIYRRDNGDGQLSRGEIVGIVTGVISASIALAGLMHACKCCQKLFHDRVTTNSRN